MEDSSQGGDVKRWRKEILEELTNGTFFAKAKSNNGPAPKTKQGAKRPSISTAKRKIVRRATAPMEAEAAGDIEAMEADKQDELDEAGRLTLQKHLDRLHRSLNKPVRTVMWSENTQHAAVERDLKTLTDIGLKQVEEASKSMNSDPDIIWLTQASMPPKPGTSDMLDDYTGTRIHLARVVRKWGELVSEVANSRKDVLFLLGRDEKKKKRGEKQEMIIDKLHTQIAQLRGRLEDSLTGGPHVEKTQRVKAAAKWTISKLRRGKRFIQDCLEASERVLMELAETCTVEVGGKNLEPRTPVKQSSMDEHDFLQVVKNHIPKLERVRSNTATASQIYSFATETVPSLCKEFLGQCSFDLSRMANIQMGLVHSNPTRIKADSLACINSLRRTVIGRLDTFIDDTCYHMADILDKQFKPWKSRVDRQIQVEDLTVRLDGVTRVLQTTEMRISDDALDVSDTLVKRIEREKMELSADLTIQKKSCDEMHVQYHILHNTLISSLRTLWKSKFKFCHKIADPWHEEGAVCFLRKQNGSAHTICGVRSIVSAMQSDSHLLQMLENAVKNNVKEPIRRILESRPLEEVSHKRVIAPGRIGPARSINRDSESQGSRSVVSECEEFEVQPLDRWKRHLNRTDAVFNWEQFPAPPITNSKSLSKEEPSIETYKFPTKRERVVNSVDNSDAEPRNTREGSKANSSVRGSALYSPEGVTKPAASRDGSWVGARLPIADGYLGGQSSELSASDTKSPNGSLKSPFIPSADIDVMVSKTDAGTKSASRVGDAIVVDTDLQEMISEFSQDKRPSHEWKRRIGKEPKGNITSGGSTVVKGTRYFPETWTEAAFEGGDVKRKLIVHDSREFSNSPKQLPSTEKVYLSFVNSSEIPRREIGDRLETSFTLGESVMLSEVAPSEKIFEIRDIVVSRPTESTVRAHAYAEVVAAPHLLPHEDIPNQPPLPTPPVAPATVRQALAFAAVTSAGIILPST